MMCFEQIGTQFTIARKKGLYAGASDLTLDKKRVVGYFLVCHCCRKIEDDVGRWVKRQSCQ